MENKKKKKEGMQQQEQTEYIQDHKIDLIISRGKDRLKHAIVISEEKLTKTKKQVIKEMALQLEQANYPVNQICDRLTKSLKGLVHERTVRDALDSKYKNVEQMNIALQQNQEGGTLYRQQQQQELEQKEIKDFDFEDIEIANVTQLRQVAKHFMSRSFWWEQQVKQKDVEIAELKKKIASLGKHITERRELAQEQRIG